MNQIKVGHVWNLLRVSRNTIRLIYFCLRSVKKKKTGSEDKREEGRGKEKNKEIKNRKKGPSGLLKEKKKINQLWRK